MTVSVGGKATTVGLVASACDRAAVCAGGIVAAGATSDSGSGLSGAEFRGSSGTYAFAVAAIAYGIRVSAMAIGAVELVAALPSVSPVVLAVKAEAAGSVVGSFDVPLSTPSDDIVEGQQWGQTRMATSGQAANHA
jgi:hypothetical protein